MMKNIQHDHYPEIVENGQGVHRLELTGLYEQLQSPLERRTFFATLADEDYKRMTGYINSVTQNKPVDYEYGDGRFIDGDTPPPEDKERLMKMAFQTVRTIAGDPDLDDKTALRRAGLAMAGAVNYVHAYDDGNGRTSRIMQYLIEFGTERGDAAVNEELYALIRKLPVYDSDGKDAINNAPHPALDRALDAKLYERDPVQFASLSGRQAASERVVAFLDMMRGDIQVPVNEQVVMNRVQQGKRFIIEYAEPGEIDGVELVERQYLRNSAIPNRLSSDVPEGANRVMAERLKVVAAGTGALAVEDFLGDYVT